MEQKVPKTPKRREGSLRWWAENGGWGGSGHTLSHTHVRRLLQYAEQMKIIQATLGAEVWHELVFEIHLSKEAARQLSCMAETLPTEEVLALVEELRGMKQAIFKARNQLVARMFFSRLKEIKTAYDKKYPS